MASDLAGAAPAVGAWAIYRRLLGYALPYWPLGALAITGLAIEAGATAAFTRLMEPLLDDTFVNPDPQVIAWLPIVIVGLFLVRGTATYCADVGMAMIGRRVVAALRGEVFARYLALPAPYFDQESSGLLISRLSYNVEQVAQAATDAVKVLIQDSLLLVLLLSVMLYQSVQLTLTAFVLAPAVALVVWLVGQRYRRISRNIQGSMGEVTRMAQEAVQGHKVIKIYAGQDSELARFEAVNRHNRQQHVKMSMTNALATTVIQLVAAGALATIVYVATRETMIQELSAGKFTSLFIAMMLMLPSLKRLTNVQGMIQKGVAAAHSLFEVLDQPGEAAGGTLRVPRVRGEVRFEGVSLRYREGHAAALREIDLALPAGSITALVGRSGSGKTSLAGLLPRFYLPGEGRVLVDGRELSEYALDNLRAQIALVSQDIVLFDDSIGRNIAYGALGGSSPEAIRAAAEAANALEFIDPLPDGMDTLVGERGVLLSGGQRQRIAIARAILKDAPILILDEATSALDNHSERLIQEALERIMGQRTTLVIAHRLSTIERADQVVVLDQGRIVEQGRHPELLALGGHYAALYASTLNAGEAS